MRLLLTLVISLLLAGCGYRQNNEYDRPVDATAPGPRPDVRTIAVPTFENRSGIEGIEQQITQAVRDAMVSSTPYKLREASAADTALEGRIVAAEYARADGATTRPAEFRRMRVEFRWRDLWTERNVLGWTSVEAASPEGVADAMMASIGVPRTQTPRQDGYTWHSLYRQDVRTVAVPIFTNKSFARGLEFQLTKAVSNYIESSTPYKVVSRQQADTILEGEIVSVKGGTVSSDSRTALPQEQMITIRVNFIWKDLRSGKILVQRRNFDQNTMYYPTLGEGASVGRQSGAERLAVGIVQEMQADW